MKDRLLIGVITTDCCCDYQSEIMRGIITQAFKSSCDAAVLCPLNNFFLESVHKQAEKNIFSLILSDIFDGFLYDRNAFHNEKIKLYIDELCRRSGKPVMLLDYANHKLFETTMADDIDAFELIADHLIDVHGYKKIYCITGPKGELCAEERLKGYLRSMKKHGLPIDRSFYEYGDFWINSASDFAARITSGRLEKPDAVICGNDFMAVTLSEKLISGGFRVPEDIAVTGYDASMEGYRANPSITSYKRPNYQLGAESFRRLYRIITGRICSKVPDEPFELRLGKSCGCAEDPSLKHDIQRRLKINDIFQNRMLCGDMSVDLTNADNLPELLNSIDNYTYLLYKISHIYICITEKFERTIAGNTSETLDFSADDPVHLIYDKSAVSRHPADKRFSSSAEAFDALRRSRSYPSFFYISPLHYNDRFFGYAAISFGKNPITYTRLYAQWINHINIALEQVRMKSVMNTAITKLDALTVYDDLTGLLGRNGFKNAIMNEVAHGSRSVTYIHIELPDIKKIYYQNGSKKTISIIKNFAIVLRSCLRKDEICGTISPGCFGVLAFFPERAEEIFSSVRQKLRSPESSCDTAFSAGVYTGEISVETDLGDLMYDAAVNRLHSYYGQTSSVNPQFEKLCSLRGKMMKNPELSWNISDIAEKMFISKSYLQKMYKSYFGKSIIEELIMFRLEKAKELLIETDLTVSDIARDCGYSTYNYFVRQFRSAEGVSPSEFRELRKK